ncbi:MAG: DNA polymerase III subunit gamma/tau [Planctomycetes bacterium]|nr:DNA polymerase III subunit gamma/tau [Planctomycetota bacterium]
MYEVMARRYRPAHFEDVVGQEHIADTLKNAIGRDRVAHAYMFTGGHGCGKTTMARILAKALVCEQGPTAQPCGVCPICQDVASGRDSDVLEIDGASNNGIEQIRQLREQASYVPTRARYKIYIIDEVHMLSDGAFNALLKTLEEPPRHVKFILATTDPHKVPDTILSRCQRFDFRLVPQNRLAEFFRKLSTQEGAGITDDALDAVAAFSEGSVRDGLVLLDQLLSFSDGEVTREDVEAIRGVASAENVQGIFAAIKTGDVKTALRIVDEVASRGTNVGDFLDQLIGYGRDIMYLVAGGGMDGVGAYGPAREALSRLAQATSLETALLQLDVLTQARTRVRARALTNPLVALEMAVARLAGLGGVVPVEKILAHLAELPAGSLPAPAAAAETQPVTAPSTPVAEPLRSAPSTRPVEAVRSVQPDMPRETPPEPAAVTIPEETDPGPDDFSYDSYETATALPPPNRDAAAVVDTAEMNGGSIPTHSASDTPSPLPDAIAAEPEPVPSEPPPDPTVPSTPPPPTASAPEPVMTPSPASSQAATVTKEQVEGVWSKILDEVAVRYPALMNFILRLRLAGVEEGRIVLAGSRTLIEPWEDERRRAHLEESAEAVLGYPIRFHFVTGEVAAPVRPAATRQAPNRARPEFLKNSAVDLVESLFEGVIVAYQEKTVAPPSGPDAVDDADGDDDDDE